jgi:hypothetical protein
MDIVSISCTYKERFTKDGDAWEGHLGYGYDSYKKVSKAFKERFPSAFIGRAPASTKTAIVLLVLFDDHSDEAEFILCQEALSIDIT